MNLDERTITSADAADLPSIIGELHRLSALAFARLMTPTNVSVAQPEPTLLTVDEAAALVSLTPTSLRRSAKFRAARRVLGARTIRFERDFLLRAVKRST